jgi:uncharacterized protein YceK
MMKKIILNISLLLIVWIFYSACASIVSQIDLTGKWGGKHIAILVSDSSTTLEYACAHGTIDEAIIMDDENDEAPDEHPALYKGHIVGNEMTLILVLTDTDTEIGTFSLTRGVDPLIHKCL